MWPGSMHYTAYQCNKMTMAGWVDPAHLLLISRAGLTKVLWTWIRTRQ